MSKKVRKTIEGKKYLTKNKCIDGCKVGTCKKGIKVSTLNEFETGFCPVHYHVIHYTKISTKEDEVTETTKV